jgi:hypothetical protein
MRELCKLPARSVTAFSACFKANTAASTADFFAPFGLCHVR